MTDGVLGCYAGLGIGHTITQPSFCVLVPLPISMKVEEADMVFWVHDEQTETGGSG